MEFNMDHWAKEIVSSSVRKALPIMTYPGLELSGKKIGDVITSGKEQYEIMQVLAKKFPSAAAVTIMDLSVEAETFGSPVAFYEDDVPTVTSKIVSDQKTVEALAIPELEAKRCGVYLEAVRLAAEKINDRPTFGGMIGPYSLAGRLFDMTEIMMAIIMDPDTIHLLLEKCVKFLTAYALAFKKAGANGLIIAEPAAGLLSYDHCHTFSSFYVKQIVDAVQDEEFFVILHNCGNTKHLVSSMLSTGAKGLHFGNAVKMSEIMPLIPEEYLAFGNIDPARSFRSGNPQTMFDQTWELLASTANYKNFVLSSGCDVPPYTPIQNIEAFYAALDKFNQTYFRK